MVPRRAFGATGFESNRVLFGAASSPIGPPGDDAMREDAETFEVEPLFVRGVRDAI